jgi:crotonobetainyl-CoA:carnitine CoA-transferase CaiB-like acyl-CoA transferase
VRWNFDATRGSDAREARKLSIEAPLAGVRVIDFGQLIAVPCAGMILAELGGDVIKVERPTGDPGRGLRSTISENPSGMFSAFNRSKRSVLLDLKSDSGRAAARALVASADVVLQGFRPGVMERLGLGYEELSAAQPTLVYGSLSAFGDGEAASRGGVDLIIQAESGMMSLTGSTAKPTRIGFAVVDVAAGNVLAQGILAALLALGRSGRGAEVKVSLIDVSLHLQSGTFTEYAISGVEPIRTGDRIPYGSPAGVFSTADGQIAISAYLDQHWKAFCSVLDRTDLINSNDFATASLRILNAETLWDVLQAELTRRSTDEWLESMLPLGIPAGRVRTHRDIEADPALRRSGTVVRVGDKDELGVSLPTRFSYPGGILDVRPAPGLGEHTQEVFDELGIGRHGLGSTTA